MSTKPLIRNCRIKKQCHKNWDVLKESSPHGILKDLRIDNIRYCEQCDDFIWWCDNEKDLIDALKGNRCVAFS